MVKIRENRTLCNRGCEEKGGFVQFSKIVGTSRKKHSPTINFLSLECFVSHFVELVSQREQGETRYTYVSRSKKNTKALCVCSDGLIIQILPQVARTHRGEYSPRDRRSFVSPSLTRESNRDRFRGVQLPGTKFSPLGISFEYRALRVSSNDKLDAVRRAS